ncbi:hypothetical protein QL285_033225 [Trifolium repens]|nr:hypothetical protein QL285_033225 [Trifolium repens]
MEDDHQSIRSSNVKDIREALDTCNNSYVQAYNVARNAIHSQGASNIRMKILGKRGRDGRRYNLPTASEVAALIVGDFDGTAADRDVIVECRSGLLQRISTFEPSYWPLQYPLLFPRGEDGYRKDIEFRDNERKESRKRKFISHLEWLGYRIQQRQLDASTIVFSRRLFHQFLVDSFSTVESARLKYLKDHQKDLRADMYKGLTEALLRGDADATNAGKRIVLPASFVGGARYMLSSGDRPDLVSWIFKLKLKSLIKDIKNGYLFGKVKAVVYTIEFQKRGLPHAHFLVFLQPAYRIIHPHNIDKIICAEIPDKDRDPELFDIVTSLMIHGPCDPPNKDPPCLQNGRCGKYFPKNKDRGAFYAFKICS